MKKKNMVFLGILLLILLVPMAGMMLPGLAPDNTTFNGKPGGGFQIAADPAVVSADTKVTNLDDADNLYGGGYKTYTLVVNCSDADGAGDIANLTLNFGGYFAFQWLNTSTTSTELNGTTKVRIGTSSNTTTASGNTLNFTINFKMEWAMNDIDDVDLVYRIYDTTGATATASINLNYDFDTDLTLAATSFVSTQTTGAGGAINFNSGIVVSYEDSGGDNYPLNAETDFLVTRTPATGSTDSWSGTYTDGTGVIIFAAITAGHIAQMETYTFTTYSQGTTATDLFGSTKTDKVDVSNTGGGDDDDPTIGGLTPQQMLIGVFLVIGGYLVYSIFLSGGKSKARGRSKGKKKSSKRKGRR